MIFSKLFWKQPLENCQLAKLFVGLLIVMIHCEGKLLETVEMISLRFGLIPESIKDVSL